MNNIKQKISIIGALLIVFMLGINPVYADWVLKNQKTGKDTTFASSVSTAAFTNALTPGSIIICGMEADVGGLNAFNTPTDTAGNIYKRALSKSVASTFDLEIWYAVNNSSTASNIVTATDNAGGSDGIISCDEWTGNIAVNPLETASSTNSGVGTSLTSGAFSTTNDNDLLWEAGALALGSGSLSAGSGYSNFQQNNTAFSNEGNASQVVTVAGSYNGAMTDVGTSASWAMGMVAIKGPAASSFSPWQFTDF